MTLSMMVPTSTAAVKQALDTFGSEREVKRDSERGRKRGQRWENTWRTAPVELIREGDVLSGTGKRVVARRMVLGHVCVMLERTPNWIDLGIAGEARSLIETMIVPGEYDPIYNALQEAKTR